MANGPETRGTASREVHKSSADTEKLNNLRETARANRAGAAESRHQRPDPEARAHAAKSEVNAGARKMAGEAKFKAFHEGSIVERSERANRTKAMLMDMRAGRERFQAKKAQDSRSNINPEVAARINAARPAMEQALAQERAAQPLPKRESKLNQEAGQPTAQAEAQQTVNQTEAAGEAQSQAAEAQSTTGSRTEKRLVNQQAEKEHLKKEKADKEREAKAEQEKVKEKFNKLIKNIQENAKQELELLDGQAEMIKNQLENNNFYNVLKNHKLKGELKGVTKEGEDLKKDTKERVSRLEKKRDERLAAMKSAAEKVSADYNKLIGKMESQIARSEAMIRASQRATIIREGLRGVGNLLGRAARGIGRGVEAGARLAGRGINAVGNAAGNFAGNVVSGYQAGRAEAGNNSTTTNAETPDNVVSLDEARRVREARQNTERQAPGPAAA